MPLSKEAKEELIQRLWNCGTFLLGQAAKIRYGIDTPVFMDLRGDLYDDIATFRFLGKCISDVVTEEFGESVKLVGVPDTGTPLAVCASVVGGLQLAVLRKTLREQGPRRRHLMGIRGESGNCVLVDDVIASGASKARAIAQLREEHAHVLGIVVVVNRCQNGDRLMGNLGYPVKALLSIHDVVDFLVRGKKLESSAGDEIRSYLYSRQYTFEQFWTLLEREPAARAVVQQTLPRPLLDQS